MHKDIILKTQQGDVMVKKISSFPENLERVAPIEGKNILASGEHTGHHHTMVADKTEVFRSSDHPDHLYFEVKQETEIVHGKLNGGTATEPHKPNVIAPGKYFRGLVKQKCHFTDEVESVRD